MRTPGDQVSAEQVRDAGDNARLGPQVVNAAMAQMGRADRIAVAAGGPRPGQQFVEVAANLGDLVRIENPNPFQIAVAIEGRDLFGRQTPRMVRGTRMQTQIALDAAQFFGGWDELRSG